MKTLSNIITRKIMEAFEQAGYNARYGQVTKSNRPDLCQYQCNGAMAAAKEYKKAPIVIANEISAIAAKNEMFKEVSAVMPGFLNINLNQKAVLKYLQQMSEEEKFGYEPKMEGKTVVVDYGGANVAKPLHIGHLRSAIIGESVKRLLRYGGYNTIGDVHLGDWGLPMGLIITELHKRKPELVYFDDKYTGEYPSEAPFTLSELEEIYPYASGISKTDEAYREEARQATVELQKQKRGYYALWQHILKVSVTDLKKNYDNLNVSFELWGKESDADKYIDQMIEDIKQKGLAYISEGALVVDVKEESDTKEMPPCILRKSDGAALYASTDLATIIDREKRFKPDKIVYLTDKRQNLHFEQVFRTARKAGIVSPETELEFIGFGTMNGEGGKPYKTRDGGVLRLEFLINDIAEEVFKKVTANREMEEKEAREISKIVGLAALKYGDLSNQASKDYIFDIERFASFEGNTGPYILYTMVRIKSIISKYAEITSLDIKLIKEQLHLGNLKINCNEDDIRIRNDSENNLILGIAEFQDMILHAVDELAPHKVCAYIYELANLFNSFYHENKIISEENIKTREEWIALITLVLKILEECIDLLAINAPERM